MKFLKLAMIVALFAALFAAAPTLAENLTGPQKNAVRSAKQYLSMMGFITDRTYSATLIRCWGWL